MTTHPNQCQRVLQRLQRGPATTWDIGPALGILCPTKRVSELRRDGHEILATERYEGKKRVVTYRLTVQPTLAGLRLEPSDAAQCGNEHVTAAGEHVAKCCNCGRAVLRQPKARPPLPGEHVFCKPFCRDAFWNRRKKETAA